MIREDNQEYVLTLKTDDGEERSWVLSEREFREFESRFEESEVF